MSVPDLSWLKNKPFAHRGPHMTGVPENSLAAVQRAVEHGYPVEIDVQVTSDGVAVVFHDWTLERLTGHAGLLTETSSSRLSTPRLCDTTESIPRLEEVLDLLANYGTNLFTRPHFIAHQWQRLPATAPNFLRNFLKLPLIAWTVRSESKQKTASRWADNIIFENFLPSLKNPPL